ncbi:hypothetical protein IAU60_002816 [Kwoniella sp. DSM 27419]
MAQSPFAALGGRGLGDMLDAIPTQADAIPDSCSEGSDAEDEEVAHHAGGGNQQAQSASAVSRARIGTTLTNPERALSGWKRFNVCRILGRPVAKAATEEGKPLASIFAIFGHQANFVACKQHKTWDGDAYIKVEGNKITMIDENGEYKANTSLGDRVIEPEAEFRLGSFEVCVDCQVSEAVFRSSTTILNRAKPPVLPGAPGYRPNTFTKPFKAPTPTHKAKAVAGYIPARAARSAPVETPVAGPSRIPLSHRTTTPPPLLFKPKPIPAAQFYGAPTKTTANRIIIGEKNSKERQQWGGALHDPAAAGAVVMERPPDKWAKSQNTELVDVVVDPILASIMREHQKEGVKFMYSCVMGLTGAEGQGCILADDMGLGKTLQTIALVYTLLKQSPFANQTSVVKKALIVCPVTLVDNWRKEFKKWVDRRVTVLAVDGADSSRINSFIASDYTQVLIIGYERLRKEVKKLKSCIPPIDLIVCDEGHRLKSKDSKNQTIKMFDELKTQRRIILSGTPIQNQLTEYWAMANFTCPGILGKYSAFNKQYEKPIMAGRAVGASAKAVELGEERAMELTRLSKEFVLRREAHVLSNFLPPKSEYVVFAAPSLLQLSVLGSLLNPSIVSGFIRGYGAQSLALIDLMRKISNSPMLLRKKDDDGVGGDELGSAIAAAKAVIPLDTNVNDVRTSGKMVVLDKMLHSLWHETNEKVVVVSNWTSTLNLLQDLLKIRKYHFVRLDGSTPQKQRQDLVDRFNRDTRRQDNFVFLLSAKAGGIGLNLIGASRLFLFDSDWNPSTDLQAMARIHRDGQKRPVFIYRLLTTNTIDEKIYQRQITKTGLSDQMMDQGQTSKDSKDSFSNAELKDIFSLKVETNGCQTHDLLGCDCITTEHQTRADSVETSTVASTAGHVDVGEDDDDEEDEQSGFMNAAQYDPEPTPKMVRKAAAAQQQKLKALKKWAHFDGLVKSSFNGVADTLLYNMMYEAWDAEGNHGVKNGSHVKSHKTLPVNARKKRKGGHGNDDESGGEIADRVADSAGEEEEPSGLELISSDEETVAVPSKRQHVATGSRVKGPLGEAHEGPAGEALKHDLREIAAKDEGAGRVMFVFEKLSKAQMGSA